MRPLAHYLLAGTAVLLIGCGTDPATSPASPAATEVTSVRHPWHPTLTVMSQNIYVGANVDAILAALGSGDPALIQQVLAEQMQVLAETDFPTRAAALAAEIADRRPHVVGLQEMSRIHLDLNVFGVPATYDMDFLPVLLAALEARGLHYRVAAKVENMTAEPVPGYVRLTDFDVVLVDGRRTLLDPEATVAHTYAVNLGPVAPGVSLVRGFVAIKVRVEGRWYRVGSTHLEDDLGPLQLSDLRAAQMQELVGTLEDAPRAIIMGDLNDTIDSPMYQVAVGAGFIDAWDALHPGREGATCCHSSNLTNDRIPDERIDFVLARGFARPERLDGHIARIGLAPEDLVDGPFHPIYAADHAGLVARLIGDW